MTAGSAAGKRWVRWATVPVLVVAAVSLTGEQASAVSASLTRYPYLTDSIQSSITINWATDRSATIGSVVWGPVGNCAANTMAATRSNLTVISTLEYQWKATIPVSPDITYCYRVQLGGTDLLGADPSPQFTSQVAAGSTTPFSFAVFGDWGQSNAGGVNPDQTNVMQQLATSGARFAVMTGDTAYPGGSQKEYGDLQQSGQGISGVFGPQYWAIPGRSLPVFNVTGNHGFTNGRFQVANWPEENAAATSGGRYLMESYPSINGSTPASYPSFWYAFDAGPARFYILDAAWADGNVGTAPGGVYQQDHDAHWTTSSPQYIWLQNDLATHPDALKFAFWHYPLYSDSNSQPSDTFLQGGAGTLQGLLNQNHVAIAFNGHAHGYERNAPDSGGMISYVLGNGGATLGSIGTCHSYDLYAIGSGGSHCGAAPAGLTNDHVYGFAKVTVNGRQVTVTPTDELGRTFDIQTYTFPALPPDGVPPTTPGNLTGVAVNSSRVDLSWTASMDNVGVTGYRVYRNGTLLTTVTGLSHSDTTAAASTTYTYQVSAIDGAGNESTAASTSVTTPVAGVTLTFAPTDDATIDSSAATSNFGAATRVTADNSPVTDALLKFTVSGTNQCPISSASLKLTVGSSGNDNSVYGGDVYGTASSAWSEGTVAWNTAPAAGATKVGSVPIAVALNTSYTFNVSPLVTGDGVVSIRLRSTSSDGVRYYSKEGGTGAQDPLLQVNCAGTGGGGDTVAPTQPGNLTGTAVNSSRVDLTWTASSDNVGVTGYKIYRDGSLLATAGTATSYSDTTAVAGTHTYQVSAVDAAANESTKASTSVTTPPQTTLTFAPTDDATIDASASTANFGSNARVVVDNSPVNYSLLKFTVSGSSGCTVSSAKLRLTVGGTSSDNSGYGGDVYGTATSGWSEGTVTWSNAPAAAATKIGSVPTAVALNTSYLFDVTPLVTGDGVVSMLLKSTSSDGARYYSKEGGTAAQAPQLSVTC